MRVKHGNNAIKFMDMVSKAKKRPKPTDAPLDKDIDHWEEHCPKPQKRTIVVCVTGGEEGVGKVDLENCLGVNPMI